MAEAEQKIKDQTEEFSKLLEKQDISVPQVGDNVNGVVIYASKAEVRLDINGVLVGVIRGPELYPEAEEYANLQPGDTVEAMVIDEENENGEMELSFRKLGQAKAWSNLEKAYKDKTPVTIKVVEANKGGLIVRYKQIKGFLPVSQLAPENYPRVSGGDKSKILDKLKSFTGQEIEAKVINLGNEADKIIFSEKELWNERKKDVISQYKVGTIIEGTVTAITNFGVFVSFGDNMEGLIHISELAWQRVDSPHDIVKVGDDIKAEVVSREGTKIFLSAKRLVKDPWQEATERYKEGEVVKGKILKVNPFGLFVKLDDEIHGLAHISQLELDPKEKITDKYKAGEEKEFEIMNIEPKEHRLGLRVYDPEKKKKEDKKKKTTKKAEKEDKEDKEEKTEEKEKKTTKKTSSSKKKETDKEEKKKTTKKAEKEEK